MSRVYFIQCGENGPIKIGVAVNVQRRMSALQGGNPIPLTLIGSVVAVRGTEAAFHQTLRAYRIRGEWFRPVLEVRDMIARALNGELPSASTVERVRGGSAVDRILFALGGQTEVARKLRVPLSTVNSWSRKGAIPHWRADALAEIGASKVMIASISTPTNAGCAA